MRITHHQARGVGLIEVLVSLVVIGIGLLGILELYAHGHRSELEAYQRAQALTLLDDMAGRISTNREAAGCYTINNADQGDFLGKGNTTTYSCSGHGTQASRALADADLDQWDDLLKGSAETDGDGGRFGGLVDARGCIESNAAGDVITIAVAWTGRAAISDADHFCAAGEYDDDALRRVVTRTIRLADLDG